ncbi:MAG: hypothetical protein IKL65_04625 [Bacilli bacterium]|nr:hypothetical protein [Bacilli bacterium]
MKKYFNLFILAFALLFAITVKVNAESCTDNCAAQIGTAKYDTLQEAIANVKDGETIELLKDITDVSANIKIEGEKGTSVTIDGKGKTVSGSAKKVFEIYNKDDVEGAEQFTVTFKDVTIKTTATEGRDIDTRTSNIKLALDDVKLITTSAANNQVITVGNSLKKNITLDLNKLTIEAGVAGYGIIVFNPSTINITNSDIKGYAALYMKGGSEGSKVTVKDSKLTGTSDHDGATDNFATIALEDDGINIDIIDSTVEVTGSGKAKQVAFSQGSNLTVEKENTIKISGESEVIVRPEGFIMNQTGAKIVVEAGVSTNLEIPEEFLPEGVIVEKDNDGNFIVVQEVVEEPTEEDKTPEKEEVKEEVKETEKEEVKNPETGDNVVTYILIGLMSLIAFGYASNKLRKNA